LLVPGSAAADAAGGAAAGWDVGWAGALWLMVAVVVLGLVKG
jgi:hypothetical protein